MKNQQISAGTILRRYILAAILFTVLFYGVRYIWSSLNNGQIDVSLSSVSNLEIKALNFDDNKIVVNEEEVQVHKGRLKPGQYSVKAFNTTSITQKIINIKKGETTEVAFDQSRPDFSTRVVSGPADTPNYFYSNGTFVYSDPTTEKVFSNNLRTGYSSAVPQAPIGLVYLFQKSENRFIGIDRSSVIVDFELGKKARIVGQIPSLTPEMPINIVTEINSVVIDAAAYDSKTGKVAIGVDGVIYVSDPSLKRFDKIAETSLQGYSFSFMNNNLFMHKSFPDNLYVDEDASNPEDEIYDHLLINVETKKTSVYSSGVILNAGISPDSSRIFVIDDFGLQTLNTSDLKPTGFLAIGDNAAWLNNTSLAHIVDEDIYVVNVNDSVSKKIPGIDGDEVMFSIKNSLDNTLLLGEDASYRIQQGPPSTSPVINFTNDKFEIRTVQTSSQTIYYVSTFATAGSSLTFTSDYDRQVDKYQKEAEDFLKENGVTPQDSSIRYIDDL